MVSLGIGICARTVRASMVPSGDLEGARRFAVSSRTTRSEQRIALRPEQSVAMSLSLYPAKRDMCVCVCVGRSVGARASICPIQVY